MLTKDASSAPVDVVDEESKLKVIPKISWVVSAFTMTGVTEATLYGANAFTKSSFCVDVKSTPVVDLI